MPDLSLCCAAPMLMSSLQFAAQIVMAKFVLYLGVVERKSPSKLTWHQYFLQGERHAAQHALTAKPSHVAMQALL